MSDDIQGAAEGASDCEPSDKARIAHLEALLADREKSLRKLRERAACSRCATPADCSVLGCADSAASKAQPKGTEREALQACVAQLRHLTEDIIHYPNPQDPEQARIRPGKGMIFSNMVGAVVRLLPKCDEALTAQAPAPAHDRKAQALALCHALEEQPGSQYQTAAVLAAFKVYRAFESIEKHGEIRQWVFDVAAPCAAVGAEIEEAILTAMHKLQDVYFKRGLPAFETAAEHIQHAAELIALGTQTDETAWLLETSGGSHALYWDGGLWISENPRGLVSMHIGLTTTKDASKAVRFVSQELAEAALKSFRADYRVAIGGAGVWKAAEHMWPAAFDVPVQGSSNG